MFRRIKTICWLCLILGYAFFGCAFSAVASEQSALNWLATVPENQLLHSPFATKLQIATQLRLVAGFHHQRQPWLNIDLKNTSTATEPQAQLVMLADNADAIWRLIRRQNQDGGLGHLHGWASNLLDTSWFLLALHHASALPVALAVDKKAWLTSQQKALHYLVAQLELGIPERLSLEQLYIHAMALQALTAFASQNPHSSTTIQQLVARLAAHQNDAVLLHARAGLLVQAVVAHSLQPYQKIDDSGNAFATKARAQQLANGSWANDAYITAVVLRALQAQSTASANPLQAAVAVRIVDGETRLPLPNVRLSVGTDQKEQIGISDAMGNIAISALKPGHYLFVLSKTGYVSVAFEVFLESGKINNIGNMQLSRAAENHLSQIQGVITELKSAAPVAKALIKITPVNQQGALLVNKTQSAFTDSHGRYQIILPKPADFMIEIHKQDYQSIKSRGAAKQSGVVIFNAKLEKTSQFSATVVGKIVDEKGNPIEGAKIQSAHQILAVSNADGSFGIQFNQPADLSLTIHKTGYQKQTFNIAVKGKQKWDIGKLVMAKMETAPIATADLSIAPMDAKTSAMIGGVMVRVDKISSNNSVENTQTLHSDSKTKLQLKLTKGRWQISTSHPAYQNTAQILVIENSDPVEYAPKLVMKPLAISAVVVNSITNTPIKNAAYTILDVNKKVIYSGITDELGQLRSSHQITSPRIEVLIEAKDYLPTRRFIHLSSIYHHSQNTFNLGEVRIRPNVAQILLPDLKIANIDAAHIKTNQQTLKISGVLKVGIFNAGNTNLINQKIKITVFEDLNFNQKIDAEEQIYGAGFYSGDMQSTKYSQTEGIQYVNIPIKGKVAYWSAPLAVLVDSAYNVIEADESNNCLYSSDALTIQPKGTLNPEIVWHWDGSKASYPDYNQVMASPVVAPLKDSNHNGVIDSEDKKYVVFTSFAGHRYEHANGVLRVLNAVDGSEYKSFGYDAPNTPSPDPSAGVAVADIDHDAKAEIIVTTRKGISCYDIDDGLMWSVDLTQNGWRFNNSYPSLFDVNHDGTPEIIVGKSVISHRGEILHHAGNWSGYVDIANPFRFANHAYVLSKNHLFDLNTKKIVKSYPANSAYIASAILNADEDDEPEILISSSAGLALYDLNGNKKWGNIHTTYRNAGAPVIADMDGDGKADIGIATENDYIALRADGSYLWSIPTSDYSSSITSSTIFDFENDGHAEVVYADEEFLRIIDGRSGAIKYQLRNTSGTLYESPVIVDGDNDGHADIFLVSNHYGRQHLAGATTGIRMISGKNKDWANTRHIWNQHNYHITNINDDMTVPAVEEPSWLAHNTYRLNTILNANVLAAADLTASYIQIKDSAATGQSTFKARIGNAGSKAVPAGVPVAFYRLAHQASTAELIGTVALTKPLLGGDINKSYEDVALQYSGSLADFGTLIVVANDAGAGTESATGMVTNKNAKNAKVVQEFTRKNNKAHLIVNSDWIALQLSANLEKNIYRAHENVPILSQIINLGSFAVNANIKTQITDSIGNVIVALPMQKIELAIAPDNAKTITQFWNTKSHSVGHYFAKVCLYRGDKLMACTEKPFSIMANHLNNGLISGRIDADKQHYQTQDVVMLTSRIRNTASNAVVGEYAVFLKVTNPNNEVIWQQSYSHQNLVANAIKDKLFVLHLKNAKRGVYQVTQTIVASDDNKSKQQNTTQFVVDKMALAGLNGKITAYNTVVEVGDNAVFNWQMRNQFNSDMMRVPARIELFRENEPMAFKRFDLGKINLAKATMASGVVNWQTAGKDQDKITAMLIVRIHNQDQGIATLDIVLQEPATEIKINHVHAITEPLLVYYSCTDGWNTLVQNWSLGKFHYACFDSRAGYIAHYLKHLGVPYKIVKTPWAFRHELQSGKFNQIWLLGAVEKLSPHTHKELREAAYMGDHILIDSGMHSWLNHDLYHLAGVEYRGRLQLASTKEGGDKITLAPDWLAASNPPKIANAPLNIQTNRTDYPLNSQWALLLEPQLPDAAFNKIQIAATFNAAQIVDVFSQEQKSTHPNAYRQPRAYPAIVSAHFGNGHAVALAFDLISALSLADKTAQWRWDDVLNQLLQTKHQYTLSHLPLQPVRVPISIHNKSNQAKQFVIDLTLPAGSMWLDNQGGMRSADAVMPQAQHIQNQHSYTLTVPAKTTHIELPTLRLPNLAGMHHVRVAVGEQTQNGTIKWLAQQENQYSTMSLNEQINHIQNSINQWRVFGKDGIQVLHLKMQINLIKAHLNSAAYHLAVYEAARMGATFGEMQQTDAQEIHALRIHSAQLLRALQMQWYARRNNSYPLP